MSNYIIHKNNNIVLVRGDSFDFTVYIEDDSIDSQEYILQNDDVLYFGIMDPNQPFECALVRKRYTVDDLDSEGHITIVLDPEDTEDLIPGVYYYSVKLHKLKNTSEEHIDKVITVIQKTKLTIID